MAGDPGAPFELEVEDIFHISGQGTVLSGTVRTGEARVGDSVDVCSPAHRLRVELLGIEGLDTRAMQKRATSGQRVALLVDGLEPERLPDGLLKTEEGWRVSDLAVRGRPRRSWWSRLGGQGTDA